MAKTKTIHWSVKTLIASAAFTIFMAPSVSFAADVQTPVLTIESDLYGEAFTDGNSTLKAENGIDVTYDSNTSAVLTLKLPDGSAVDDRNIDVTDARVRVSEGDGYNADFLTLKADTLEGSWTDGQLTFTLESGDLEWNNGSYPVDNGGIEWSAIGGDGNGHYNLTFTVSGIKYNGETIEDQSFPVHIYIYGREFSSRKSPDGQIKTIEEQGNGAAGYDDLVLPEAEFSPPETQPNTDNSAVWTWIGDGEKPILCDYLTDNFYISWPEGTDASALVNSDITITLHSKYGDTLVLNPGEDYSIQTGTMETQISVPYVYWPFTPVYTTMEICVDTQNVTGPEGGTILTKTYDIASVYTHMVQSGGGMDRDLTVVCYQFFGLKNLTSWEQVVSPAYYYFAYKSPDAGAKDPWEYYYAEDENGTPYITENQEEAKTSDACGADEKNLQLLGNVVFTTAHDTDPLEVEIDGKAYTFTKVYSGGKTILPDKTLEPSDGYVLTPSQNWDTHQRWAWLFINGQGWLDETVE